MIRFIILILIFIGLEFYVFRTFQHQFSGMQAPVKYSIFGIYWIIPLILVFSIFYISYINSIGNLRNNKWISYLVAIFVLFYLPKLFIVSFQIIEDLGKIGAWLVKKISNPESMIHLNAIKVSRSNFIGRIGLFVAIIPFISVIYGVAFGRYNFKLNEVSLQFENLPPAFDGFKIVQFSDLHTGSLSGQQEIFQKAIEMMNDQKPDIIVFTGDMVNNTADEAQEWIQLLSKLSANNGKYSILGNHDYGDYYRWKSDEEKEANLNKLKNIHKQMGFRLLLNESIVIHHKSDSIVLVGVENWGEKPFPQYGNLKTAMQETNNIPFKILLSHDPSHWEYEVRNKMDIALTLSGHTHGMQLAVNIAGFSWSPVSFKYPRWKGLYADKGQYLYVNIGLGYIGFPGRIGTNPEISVFTLRKHDQ